MIIDMLMITGFVYVCIGVVMIPLSITVFKDVNDDINYNFWVYVLLIFMCFILSFTWPMLIGHIYSNIMFEIRKNNSKKD